MPSSNPFRQPLPNRKEILLKTRLNQANNLGKDTSSGHPTRVVASKDYLWLGSDFSIPLAWLELIEPVGPGFRLAWRNELEGKKEQIFLCARNMFTYNKKERDRIVSALQQLAKPAQAAPPVLLQSAPTASICEKCSLPNARVHDYVWFLSFFLMWLRKPDRKLLCDAHAKQWLYFVVIVNALVAYLGVPGLVIAPLTNYSQAKSFRDVKLISSAALWAMVAFSCLPLAAVLAIVAYAIVAAA